MTGFGLSTYQTNITHLAQKFIKKEYYHNFPFVYVTTIKTLYFYW